MNENIKKYTIEVDEKIANEISASWGWLVGGVYKPKLISLFGDVILAKDNGPVFLLNVGTAELDLIASGWSEFAERAEGEMGINWFMIPIADDLTSKGVKLSPGQCYGYKTLPVLGGEYAAENFYPSSIKEAIGVTGDMHKQMKDLPDGAPIRIKIGD